ncbi:MAG: sarcosine oxidase subunit gamma, partial [Steroidobacteraceae bacterium]
MRADPTVIETSAFAGLPTVTGSGRGVIATERDGLGIARIAARSGQAGRAAELLRAQLGIEPPNRPKRASCGDVGIAGTAPQTWLATCEGAGNAFAQSLRSLLGDCASVADQSDAYVILRLTGSGVRATLAKLVPIDLHPRSFEVSDVAQTVCGYVNVMLWRLEDTALSHPVFEVWVGRSLAVSLY